MSSLPFLGFTLISFIITFGVVFYLVPTIFSSIDEVFYPLLNPDSVWHDVYVEIRDRAAYLVPITMLGGIIILGVRILMAATVRGRD